MLASVDQAMTTLTAATSTGLHLLGAQDRVEFEDRDVRALYLDAAAGRWVIVDGQELWRNTGAGWKAVASSSDLSLNCLLIDGDNVWVGTSDARLLRLDDGKLTRVASFDQAPGRAEWFTPWGGPPDVRSFTLSGGQLFANVHVGGILRSERDGSAWEPTLDIGADVHEVTSANGVVVAATAWGFASSRDAGKSWEFEDEDLHASYARAVAVGEDTLFMTACDGPFGGRSAIYRRPLSGTGFAKCEVGLPEWFADNIDTGCVSASGTSVSFGTKDGRVFLSSDGGKSWEQVGADLGQVRWLEFGGLD
ncbi:MAG: hypothetical protein ABR505_09305 [Actinomycetota bacterium]